MLRDDGHHQLSRRSLLRGAAAAWLGAATGAGWTGDAAASTSTSPHAIDITAKPITSFKRAGVAERRFGALEFRGGLVLSSGDKDFGGFSGLVLEADGRRLLAVSDEGSWLAARLVYDADKPVGLAEARLGPLQARNGRPLERKRDADAEAITLLDGNLTRGTVLIGYERNHRLARHSIVDGNLAAPTKLFELPPEARSMRSNKGLEAVTVMRGGPHKGAVVAFSERYPGNSALHMGWMWVDGEPHRLTIPDIADFEITDAASLADGTLLVLERRFRWTEGVRMRLRRFEAGVVRPGALPVGDTLLAADGAYEIDNMEGLAVHAAADGAIVLTLISDNNFNTFLQRTLLLQFTLHGHGRQAHRAG